MAAPQIRLGKRSAQDAMWQSIASSLANRILLFPEPRPINSGIAAPIRYLLFAILKGLDAFS
jgi:hypothetical protein